MGSQHRIHWFARQIREGRYPNSTLLAQRFEISRRQAQRDIEYLAVTMQAPLVYVAKKRGYVYENKTYTLPMLYMTEQEKRVLDYLAFRYRQYEHENSAAVRRVSHLLERFASGEEDGGLSGGEVRLPIFEVDPRRVEHFTLLSHAIQACLAVHLHLRTPEPEERRPLRLVPGLAGDRLFAFDEWENVARFFPLDNVARVTVTDRKFNSAELAMLGWTDVSPPVRRPYTARYLFWNPAFIPGSRSGIICGKSGERWSDWTRRRLCTT